jgi:hypothetical protein
MFSIVKLLILTKEAMLKNYNTVMDGTIHSRRTDTSLDSSKAWTLSRFRIFLYIKMPNLQTISVSVVFLEAKKAY